jgi:hypothetical protein
MLIYDKVPMVTYSLFIVYSMIFDWEGEVINPCLYILKVTLDI